MEVRRLGMTGAEVVTGASKSGKTVCLICASIQ